jgi:hypothetical protein
MGKLEVKSRRGSLKLPDGRFFYRMVGKKLKLHLTTLLKSRKLDPNTISPDY